MFWVELAIYIVIISSLIHFSRPFLWIVFALFAYRFWTLILPYKTFSKIIPFDKTSHYVIALILLTAIIYFLVMWCARSLPIVQYALLIVMALYTLREYSISDVLFFKDFLVSKGMWDISYWVNAVKDIFKISEHPDGILGIFKEIGEKIMNALGTFADYLKKI